MSAEVWKPIPSEPRYEVSTLGRVRHRKRRVPLKPSYYKNGYVRFGKAVLGAGKSTETLVHRAVAETFLGPISGCVVNHKNRVRDDNRVENLEIVSAAENQAHAMSTSPCVGGSWGYEDERLG